MYGKRHAKYADACYNVGLHHRAHGRVNEAEGFFQQAGDIYGDLYGEEHDETVEARDCAAECRLAAAPAPQPTVSSGYRPSIHEYSDEDEQEDQDDESAGYGEHASALSSRDGAGGARHGRATDLDHEPASARESEWAYSLREGNRVDAQDPQGTWYEGKVTEARDGEVCVHYVGWPSNWDEWLPRDDPRLEPLHTRTKPDGSSTGPDKSEEVPTGRRSGWSQNFDEAGGLDGHERDDDAGRGARGEAQPDMHRLAVERERPARTAPAPAPAAKPSRRGPGGSGPAALANGTAVQAKWANGEWYPAVVAASKRFDDGSIDSYSVRFDDGAALDAVPPEDVRSSEPVPAPQPAPRRRGSSSSSSSGGSDGVRGRRQAETRGGHAGYTGRSWSPVEDEDEDGEDEERGRPARMRSVSPPYTAPDVVDVDSLPVGGHAPQPLAAGPSLDDGPPVGGGMDALDETGPMEPLYPCRTCGRRFNAKALPKHEGICVNLKPTRKVFDSKAARVQGTDAAKFATKTADSRGDGRGGSRGKTPKWKAQSNQLREAMKANRMIAKAQRDGVPLSDLPAEAFPSMAQDEADDDRVPCPHCGRKFNAKAAERHIPRCQELKTKPVRSRGGGGGGGRRR